jgi:hypothetical protein
MWPPAMRGATGRRSDFEFSRLVQKLVLATLGWFISGSDMICGK